MNAFIRPVLLFTLSAVSLSAAVDIVGQEWILHGFYTQDDGPVLIENRENYTLELLTDREISIRADCNGCVGICALSNTGNGFYILPDLACTKALCADNSKDSEYKSALLAVDRYKVIGGRTLHLYYNDTDTLIFTTASDLDPETPAPAEPAGLIGPEWKLRRISKDGESIDVDKPDSYVIEFKGEGELSAGINCNSCFGSYQADDTAISFGPVGCTEMACPPDDYEQSFTSALIGDTPYEILNDSLFLIHGNDTLVLAGDVQTIVKNIDHADRVSARISLNQSQKQIVINIADNKAITVGVYTSTGRLVAGQNQSGSSAVLKTSALPSGIYHVMIESVSGRSYRTSIIKP
jgi:heat shock protein HslJ